MLFQPFKVLSFGPINDMFDYSCPVCGVICCAKGRASITANEETYILNSDSCIFVHTNVPLAVKMDDPASHLFWIGIKINYVDFQEELSGRIIRVSCMASTVLASYEYDDSGSFGSLTQVIEKALLQNVNKSEADKLETSGVVPAPSDESPGSSTFHLAIGEFLDNNLQIDFTTAQLANSLGCSSRQLNQFLQKHYSCTAREYINNYRIQKAKIYLLSSDNTITETARMTGFNSVHYFSRTFKKVVGISPQMFRGSFADKKLQ